MLGFDKATSLAANRIGDSVAAELDLRPGLVLIVPAEIDRSRMEQAIKEMIEQRHRSNADWLLPEELALILEERQLMQDTRARRLELSQRIATHTALRETVMKMIDLQRAVGY